MNWLRKLFGKSEDHKTEIPKKPCSNCNGLGTYFTNDQDLGGQKRWCHCVEPHRKGAYSMLGGGFIAVGIGSDLPDPTSTVEPIILVVDEGEKTVWSYHKESIVNGFVDWTSSSFYKISDIEPSIIAEARRQITERDRERKLKELGI